ncbi:unnamed protein product [Microthlaspi erraticum]|uniref:Reverse transcriptase domain-containing protein n=1 Tax=Microthlaspi erraticum TaxID=1685480 RepID=A0A6D2L2B5_9BRAS|nr:unnamed protein product [Microthlaspi erraticum]
MIYPISDSTWVSPVHCVPKKGGMTVIKNDKDELIPTRTITGHWMCIDYRKLNAASRKDHFPLLFIDQMLERLANHPYYCFLDGYSGFFQIPIHPNDQEKTTFTCPYGTFAYKRMPFGLCNAPATFQRCMTSIFSDLIEEMVEVFMDDFSVYGSSFSSCLLNLCRVLSRCEETNLVLNWEKCHFMVKEGIVLGHKINANGIEVDKAKIEVMMQLQPPKTVKDIRSFLGHAGFYRRFIKDFSKIARPLIRLLCKEVEFVFDADCLEAFELIKEALVSAPVILDRFEGSRPPRLQFPRKQLYLRVKQQHSIAFLQILSNDLFVVECLGSLLVDLRTFVGIQPDLLELMQIELSLLLGSLEIKIQHLCHPEGSLFHFNREVARLSVQQLKWCPPNRRLERCPIRPE